MTMLFKRILTVWFFVFTLTSNSAWADAGYGDENPESVVAAEAAGQDRPLLWGNDECADHCCHASAHIVALISCMNTDLMASPEVIGAALSDMHPGSWPFTPPHHPPII